MPAAWAQPAAFPALSSLDLSGLPLLKGSLPSSWGNLPSLVDLELGGSSTLTGALPPEWASPTSFQQLQSLRIHDTAISAAVPASWGSNTAFPQLVELALINNWPLSGQQTAQSDLPSVSRDQSTEQQQSLYPQDKPTNDSVSQHEGAWPRLQALILYNSSLRGSIHPSWGEPGILSVLPLAILLLLDVAVGVPALLFLYVLTVYHFLELGSLMTIWIRSSYVFFQSCLCSAALL